MATSHLRLNFMFSEAENLKFIDEVIKRNLIVKRSGGKDAKTGNFYGGDQYFSINVALPKSKVTLEILFTIKYKMREGDSESAWDDSSKVSANISKGLQKRINWLAINSDSAKLFT